MCMFLLLRALLNLNYITHHDDDDNNDDVYEKIFHFFYYVKRVQRDREIHKTI